VKIKLPKFASKVWLAFQYDTETLGEFLRTHPALTDKDWADLADITDGKIKRKKGRRPVINPHTEWIHKLYLALITREEKHKKNRVRWFRRQASRDLFNCLLAVKDDEGNARYTDSDVGGILKNIRDHRRRKETGGNPKAPAR
jgi:hypothetical protein